MRAATAAVPPAQSASRSTNRRSVSPSSSPCKGFSSVTVSALSRSLARARERPHRRVEREAVAADGVFGQLGVVEVDHVHVEVHEQPVEARGEVGEHPLCHALGIGRHLVDGDRPPGRGAPSGRARTDAPVAGRRTETAPGHHAAAAYAARSRPAPARRRPPQRVCHPHPVEGALDDALGRVEVRVEVEVDEARRSRPGPGGRPATPSSIEQSPPSTSSGPSRERARRAPPCRARSPPRRRGSAPAAARGRAASATRASRPGRAPRRRARSRAATRPASRSAAGALLLARREGAGAGGDSEDRQGGHTGSLPGSLPSKRVSWLSRRPATGSVAASSSAARRLIATAPRTAASPPSRAGRTRQRIRRPASARVSSSPSIGTLSHSESGRQVAAQQHRLGVEQVGERRDRDAERVPDLAERLERPCVSRPGAVREHRAGPLGPRRPRSACARPSPPGAAACPAPPGAPGSRARRTRRAARTGRS